MAKEKQKARELRQTQWWKQKLSLGLCHYCDQKFDKTLLTMDHIVPVARGGKTTKGNVVVACKACNSEKKWMTPVEMMLANNSKTID